MCNGFRTAKVQLFSLIEKDLPIYFSGLAFLNQCFVILKRKGELSAVHIAQ